MDRNNLWEMWKKFSQALIRTDETSYLYEIHEYVLVLDGLLCD